MAKKAIALIKLQIPAGKANPSPPVGPALGQHGVNIMGFCKEFNARTSKEGDAIIPVEITVYADRSFSFVTRTPPASYLIKKAVGLKVSKKPGGGSKEPNRLKVATITQEQLEDIAKKKMVDLNAKDLPGAVQIILGTCKSMGIELQE